PGFPCHGCGSARPYGLMSRNGEPERRRKRATAAPEPVKPKLARGTREIPRGGVATIAPKPIVVPRATRDSVRDTRDARDARDVHARDARDVRDARDWPRDEDDLDTVVVDLPSLDADLDEPELEAAGLQDEDLGEIDTDDEIAVDARMLE